MADVRVVIAEDNAVFRETLELLLGLRGDLTVIGSAASGHQAIELCRELQPDVLLVDYRMPGLDGAQTTSEVIRASPSTRVVCLTASVSKREVDQLFAAGAVGCLTKDEDLDRIVDAIREAASGAARV